MHHIIAHGKLREALDLLPLVDRLFPLLFLLFSKNIALGQHAEPDHRVLVPPPDAAVEYQDLALLHDPVGVLRIKTVQAEAPQILRQTFGTGTGGGQQHRPVALLFPVAQLLGQQFKAVVEAADGTHLQMKAVLDLIITAFGFHHTQRCTVETIQLHHHILIAVQQVQLSRQQIPLLQTSRHALPEFRLHRLGLLRQPVGLIQKYARVFFRKIIEKGNGFLIKIIHKAIHACCPVQIIQLLCQLPDKTVDASCFLYFPIFFKQGGLPIRLLLHLSDALFDPALG